MHWNKVTLVGVGLLGGSLGLALRRRRLADSVTGFVRRAATATECLAVGATDLATQNLEEAVTGAELVVLCTPLAQMVPVVERMSSFLKPGCIVTDVGSVKNSVVESLAPIIEKAGARFVGSHPMAGSEKTGVGAARADLFSGAVCVVTPLPHTNKKAVQQVMELWKSVGSQVIRLTPALHDELVSRSSHLPHVVAAQLANLVLHPRSPKRQAMLCANGFRDTTRIASGSPEMWRDIALANRKNLIAAIDSFVDGLSDFKQGLRQRNAAAITRFFEQAKLQRDKWSRHAQAHSPE
ncbi:MAG TPA: prephenate dehydrogenase/arogenate dehydrogenase family protein [Patescibacteria group bacterium]|nr:prephenate dehydrogenase/arogenate dehydrogenase family protein [Patescibacteria group bacterium]